jgi:hypothetical protein
MYSPVFPILVIFCEIFSIQNPTFPEFLSKSHLIIKNIFCPEVTGQIHEVLVRHLAFLFSYHKLGTSGNSKAWI